MNHTRETKLYYPYYGDLDARPHEITLLKIKHIRLKEKYSEGEIPHEAKTALFPSIVCKDVLSFCYLLTSYQETIAVQVIHRSFGTTV